MHPFGACLVAGRHDRAIRGPGCSVRTASAAGPAHAGPRARPGLATPPGLSPRCDRRWAAGSASQSASVSRWQARVSSLRAIAVVAIFLPRRLAMAW